MIDYIKKLLRSDTPESSKRFNTIIAIFMLIIITIIVFIFIWYGKLSEAILTTIVLGWFGFAGVTTAFTAYNSAQNPTYGGTSYYNPTQYTPENNNPPKPIKIGNNQEEDLSAENDRISEII